MKFKRAVALIIDVFIIIFFCELIRVSLSIMELQTISSFSIPLMYILLLCRDCFNGMSIGRRIANIQVFDNKTMKVASPVKCVLRNCFFLIYPTEALVVLFSSSGLRIGDYIVHTTVLERNVNLKDIDVYKIRCTVSVVTIIFVVLYIVICKLGIF